MSVHAGGGGGGLREVRKKSAVLWLFFTDGFPYVLLLSNPPECQDWGKRDGGVKPILAIPGFWELFFRQPLPYSTTVQRPSQRVLLRYMLSSNINPKGSGCQWILQKSSLRQIKSALCLQSYFHSYYFIKHRKNYKTALWMKGFIERKALLKERLYWKKGFLERNGLLKKGQNSENLVEVLKIHGLRLCNDCRQRLCNSTSWMLAEVM